MRPRRNTTTPNCSRAPALRVPGATFVSPCAGRELLAGQGTVALEILEALPALRTIVVPVGGAGLAGGIAGLLRAEAPARANRRRAERTHERDDDRDGTGEPTDIPDLPTLADGLSGQADAEMLAQGQAALDDIVAASEEDVASAIAYLWIEEGFKVEGAGAVGRGGAALGAGERLEFPVVVVVSGGNIDEEKHKAVLAGKL